MAPVIYPSFPLKTSASSASSVVKNPARGLTLMELIVVMAILVIMMGMSAAVYVSMSKNFKEPGPMRSLKAPTVESRLLKAPP